jgi:hypothetical protein
LFSQFSNQLSAEMQLQMAVSEFPSNSCSAW